MCYQSWLYRLHISTLKFIRKKASFSVVFTDQKDLYKKFFFQIKVEEDLKFLLAQITPKYSKKQRETATAPWYFAR